MDFTSVWRNHDTNGSIATNFGNIPYASTTAYTPNLSEFRLSSENSRIGFRADAMVHGWHVMGYMEADFHGNNAASVAVSTDSNTLRDASTGWTSIPATLNFWAAKPGASRPPGAPAFHLCRQTSSTPKIQT